VWQEIEASIQARDAKRGEVLIAKLLKTELIPQDREQCYLYRARLRLIASRANDAVEDILSLSASGTFLQPQTQEILADAYLQRFEQSSTGFADKQDLTQARQIYLAILEQYPFYANKGWVLYQLGRIHLIGGENQQAETLFRNAIFQPSNFVALVAYCFERLAFVAFYESHQRWEASVYIDKAIATYPAQEPPEWLVQAYLLRSRILQTLDMNEAIRSAQKAVGLASQNPSEKALQAESLFVLADVLSKSSHTARDVIEAVQQFLQLGKAPVGVDVTWSRAYEMLGDALFSAGRYEQAIEAYQNVLQFNPYHPWEETVYYRISKGYHLLGQHQKALNVLSKALNHSEKITEAYVYELASSIYHALGQREQAERYSKKAQQGNT
jgi:tetratricopeptide (TPR) repeat protein